nr:acyltransferase [Frigoribacterium sp. CG_9.8]
MTSPHLYEVDVVRILTFASVIAVHTTSQTVADDDLVLYGFLALVHFTREVFFALTAFVLIYSYLNRPQPMKTFLPRRFLLVGVPYLLWSVIYFVVGIIRTPGGTFGEMLLRLGGDILTGTAFYHLYFLLVTMQVYLLVPVMLWLVRRTRGKHPLLLGSSLAIQLVLTGLYMYFPDVTSGINDFNKQLFFSYQFFIIAGAVAADHSAAFLAWIRCHRRAIGFVVVATAACTLGVYIVNMLTGRSPYRAGTPLQPIEMLWSIAVALGFLAVGTWWADRRDPRSVVAKSLDLGSDRSFGIFLSHPLFIWLLLWAGDDWLERSVPKPWLTLVTYVLVVLLSLGLTELSRRSWFSLGLTGRRFSSRKSVRAS